MNQVRWLFLVLAVSVSGIASAQGAASTGTPPVQSTRQAQIVPFSFNDLAQWILASKPAVARRPIHLVLLFDRTDSVWGTGAKKDVLTTVWRRDLLGGLLQSFLVSGQPAYHVEGDSISILGFGRRTLTTSVFDVPYTRSDAARLKQDYPNPYIDTPASLSGTYLNKSLDDAIAKVDALRKRQNVLIVLVTDDILQGTDAAGPAKAQVYRTYSASLQQGAQRIFTVYLYWNDFPVPTQFVRYDPSRRAVVEDARPDRVAAQSNGVDAALEGTTAHLPPAWRAIRWARFWRMIELLAIVVGAIAIVALLLRAWYRERFEIRDELGHLDRTAYVFPARAKRLAVPNPALPTEPVGYLEAAPKLPFGMSKLRLKPARGYALALLEGPNEARHGRRKKRTRSVLVLEAGQRIPKSHTIRYRKDDPQYEIDTERATRDSASEFEGQITLNVKRAVGSARRRRSLRKRRNRQKSRGRRYGTNRTEEGEMEEV